MHLMIFARTNVCTASLPAYERGEKPVCPQSKPLPWVASCIRFIVIYFVLCCAQPSNPFRQERTLACFSKFSTLIQKALLKSLKSHAQQWSSGTSSCSERKNTPGWAPFGCGGVAPQEKFSPCCTNPPRPT